MCFLYIWNLVKEWLKVIFCLFRYMLLYKNGVKKDIEGILNIDINNFSFMFYMMIRKRLF